MIDEKLYTQEDLNNAVTKAIVDMNKVLKSNTNELKILREAYDILAYDFCRYVDCNDCEYDCTRKNGESGYEYLKRHLFEEAQKNEHSD